MGTHGSRRIPRILSLSLFLSVSFHSLHVLGAEASQPLLKAAEIRENIYCAAMITDSDYLMAGDRGRIFRSGDGGKSWQEIASETRAPLFSTCFSDADNGWEYFPAPESEKVTCSA